MRQTAIIPAIFSGGTGVRLSLGLPCNFSNHCAIRHRFPIAERVQMIGIDDVCILNLKDRQQRLGIAAAAVAVWESPKSGMQYEGGRRGYSCES
jgi:hypothetical protein